MIRLNEKHIAEIKSHGESTYPNECGGMLIGRFEDGGAKTIVETFPLENSSEENQRNRVLLLPKDVLRAEKYARENKLDVIGYYHSHPDDRAVPSQYDLDHALPVWSYIIVSVLDNLTKGASGQAVQNMNLMLGLPETTGLEQVALFP